MSYEVGKYYRFRDEDVIGYPGVVRVTHIDGSDVTGVFVVASEHKSAGAKAILRGDSLSKGNTIEITLGELVLWRLTGNT